MAAGNRGDVLLNTKYPLPKRHILLGCRGLLLVRPDVLDGWQKGYVLAANAYAQAGRDNEDFPGCHDKWIFEIIDEGEPVVCFHELVHRLAPVHMPKALHR
jgi:hypothetical protein